MTTTSRVAVAGAESQFQSLEGKDGGEEKIVADFEAESQSRSRSQSQSLKGKGKGKGKGKVKGKDEGEEKKKHIYEKEEEVRYGDHKIELIPYYQCDARPPEGWTPKPQSLDGGGMFLNRFWLPPEWLVDQYSPGRVVLYDGAFIPHNDQVREDFLDHIERRFPNSRHLLQGYYEKIQTSMGFDVPVLPSDPLPPFPVIRPVDYFDFYDLSQEDVEFFTRIRHNQIKECLRLALHHIRKLTGDTYELEDNQPEKANYYSSGSDLFFLTFKAKNSSSGEVRSFRAIVDSFPVDVSAEEPKEFHTSLSYIRRLASCNPSIT